MKTKILLSLALIATTSAVFANNPAEQKPACPSVAAIKSVGVNKAANQYLGWQAWNAEHRYDTEQSWSFIVVGLFTEPKNADEALQKYNSTLGSLKLVSEATYSPPSSLSEKPYWSCVYRSDDNKIHGIAATPPHIMFTAE